MLQVEYTNQFKKDLKLAKRRNKNLSLLNNIMQKIVNIYYLHNKFSYD